jgi:hypothetical protein
MKSFDHFAGAQSTFMRRTSAVRSAAASGRVCAVDREMPERASAG